MHLKKLKDTYHQVIIKLPLEAIIWILGLLILSLYDPIHQEHMSICVFNNLGFKYCPGCGLGRSISYLMHGDVIRSFEAHPLGMAAVLILGYRISQLLMEYFKGLKLKFTHYGKHT